MALLFLLFAFASISIATITPYTPNRNDVFQAHEPCPISWGPDNPDGWRAMRIDLVSGNYPVVHHVVTVVHSIDSLSGSLTWTCPEIKFDGAFYSYMFTPLDISDNSVYSAQFSIHHENLSTMFDHSHVINVATDTIDSGEEMLEDVDPALGGSDGDNSQSNGQPNFVAQVIGQSYQRNNGTTTQLESRVPSDYSSVMVNYTGSSTSLSGSRTSTRTSASTMPMGWTSRFTGTTSPRYVSSASSSKGIQSPRVSIIVAFCIGHFVL